MTEELQVQRAAVGGGALFKITKVHNEVELHTSITVTDPDELLNIGILLITEAKLQSRKGQC